ncbi:MAG: glycosyltransferase family 2 protein [Acidimicrobiaceae bacterium]|nr:glycosyltransferase family 2 protein [Acidimicrobiaceae bacterium]MXW74771.1 glycosyltransferase family 2 protein [Acidimicrobiaceae bacterium]MYA73444.1 glycosyltransferase family 2 protein [Acidimicrobiaceae bacterium]MYC42036.1 glycosyltransferase family 2 protein [Acidimicrobiaceae bacterium]MYD08002.1 glycosyltransferase family 2 protein [Acidimicrobiaceae bacterium]
MEGTAAPTAATAEPLDVSIVLPVHNEAPHLADELDRISTSMDESPYTWELVVVDDGSTDGSAELCKGLPKVRVLQTRRNHGSGAARRIGTEAARGRVVVWSDADMTYPNDQIPELVAELGNGDHIVGARTSEQGTFKIFRVPAKWAIRRLASYLTRTKIPDLNSGFRAFRRDVGLQFTQQLPTGFSCVTTITMAFLMNGYEVRYVPIRYKARAGRSKFHWFRDTSRYVLQVIRMILTYDPLRVALPVTAVLGAVFCAKLGYDIVDKDFRPAANTLLLGFAVLQVLVVGLLADLVVRVNRPTRLLPPSDVEESPASLD